MKFYNKIVSVFYSIFLKFRYFSFITKIEKVKNKMSPSEKALFYFASLIFSISSLFLLWRVHNYFLVEIPSFGGHFTEGIVGSPRFLNPVLAISETDKDIISLIYAGLFKKDDRGNLIPELAESYQVMENGSVYEIKIKDNIFFHDGKEITSDDVIFTVNKILDPVIKSPKRVLWEGVTSEKIDEKTIRFVLSKPYTPFMHAMTIGIIPKHIWQDASSEEFPFSEFNINPVGSGPYMIEKVTKNKSGIPTSINLLSYRRYTLDRPKIKSITFKVFQNEKDLYKAYQEKTVDSISGITPSVAKIINEELIKNTSLPRIFGLFFNQNNATIFVNQEVRRALDLATPKQKIIDEVLLGLGKALNGPTPNNIEEDESKKAGDIEAARNLLLQNGWSENVDGLLEKKNKNGVSTLSFSISTSDTPELKKTAEILKESWEDLGAQVEIKIFESGDLGQSVIKNRKYDSLLFGEIINTESDLYPFWHSSQRNDPGLNVSLYANITVDKMLEEIQKETDLQEIETKKEILIEEIKKDVPAIFLFSPDLIYLPAKKIHNILIKETASQSERFVSIKDWYIETDKVWKIFTNQN